MTLCLDCRGNSALFSTEEEDGDPHELEANRGAAVEEIPFAIP